MSPAALGKAGLHLRHPEPAEGLVRLTPHPRHPEPAEGLVRLTPHPLHPEPAEGLVLLKPALKTERSRS